MRKLRKLYPIFAILAIVAIGLAVAYAGEYASATAGVTLAVAGVVGTAVNETVTTEDARTAEIFDEDVSKEITKISPDKFPLDTIMRHPSMRTDTVSAQEHWYYQRSSKPFRDDIDSSATGDGSTAANAAKNYTYASGNGLGTYWIKVKQVKLWRKHDTLLMRRLTVLDTGLVGVISGASNTVKKQIMFYVKDVDVDNNAIQVKPMSGVKHLATDESYVMPDFAATQILVRMGPAKSEKAFSTDPIAILPKKYRQYTQNFMAQIEESTFEALTKKKVEYGLSDQERDNIESMKGEIELSCLFGEEAKIVDGNDATYFTRGITKDITKKLTYGEGGDDRTITKAQYTEWLRQVFVGNKGSRDRFLFAGSKLIAALEQLRETYKTIASNTSTAEHLGVVCQDISSTFGVLHIIPMPSFDETDYEDCGVVLDMTNVRKIAFIPMKATVLDLKSSGQKNAAAKLLQEVSALVLRYPECHAIIEPAE